MLASRNFFYFEKWSERCKTAFYCARVKRLCDWCMHTEAFYIFKSFVQMPQSDYHLAEEKNNSNNNNNQNERKIVFIKVFNHWRSASSSPPPPPPPPPSSLLKTFSYTNDIHVNASQSVGLDESAACTDTPQYWENELNFNELKSQIANRLQSNCNPVTIEEVFFGAIFGPKNKNRAIVIYVP